MMSNILIEGAEEFMPVDYTSLLNKVLDLLQKEGDGLFRASQQAAFLTIDVDQIATQVAQAAQRLKHPLGERAKEVRVATVYFGDSQDSFISQIKKNQQELERLLQAFGGRLFFLGHLLLRLAPVGLVAYPLNLRRTPTELF
jgi:uncharacterized protein YukE